MILVGIDIDKNRHTFSIIDKETGEILANPSVFNNSQEGFRRYTVALINPTTTDLTRKLQGGITKNDPLDSLTICDVIGSNPRKKPYRITKVNRFDLYEQKQLTRHHHNLKEELNVYKNPTSEMY